MTWDEYNKLFHKLGLNRHAFRPLMECDDEIIRLVEAAVAAEREACAKVADLVAREIDDTNGTATYIAAAIRARGER